VFKDVLDHGYVYALLRHRLSGQEAVGLCPERVAHTQHHHLSSTGRDPCSGGRASSGGHITGMTGQWQLRCVTGLEKWLRLFEHDPS